MQVITLGSYIFKHSAAVYFKALIQIFYTLFTCIVFDVFIIVMFLIVLYSFVFFYPKLLLTFEITSLLSYWLHCVKTFTLNSDPLKLSPWWILQLDFYLFEHCRNLELLSVELFQYWTTSLYSHMFVSG